MSFYWFVVPFAIGFHYMLLVLLINLLSGWFKLPSSSRRRFGKRLFSKRLFFAVREIFMESLLHRKLFKVNLFLGLMHVAFAFGWFLLIAFGKIETHLLTHSWINPVWVPIFLKRSTLFDHSLVSHFFAQVMDLLLLAILIALVVAIGKRFVSKSVGMKHTTKHVFSDNLALFSLWAIFPMRFLAESAQAVISNNGGFLTQTAGSYFFSPTLTQSSADIFWWGYSFALGTFFIALPYSRYLHIPAEIVLITARHLLSDKDFNHPVLRQLENNSCSRCGVCIDVCPQRKVNSKDSNQSVYLLRALRKKSSRASFDLAFNCLQCNKCTNSCPVGINLMAHRNSARNAYAVIAYKPIVNLPVKKSQDDLNVDVLYFEGCMGRLNPRTGRGMEQLFTKLGLSFYKLDDAINCCGRGANLLADKRNIKEVMAQNSDIINRSSAKMLVTSCPICYKSFKEHYSLRMNVVHHSQFIAKNFDRLTVSERFNGVSHYHNPCELGLWSDVEGVVKKIDRHIGWKCSEGVTQQSICCGGSIANLTIDAENRSKIGRLEIDKAVAKEAKYLVTSCPLCKKTLSKTSTLPVVDIVETIDLT